MTTLRMDSRRSNQIDNCRSTTPPIYGEELEAQAYLERYPGATHRPTPVCSTYNCHGLTFGSRRAEIIAPAVVRQVLHEDDYQKITLAEVLPGDVAIYITSDGDIEHSGIVVEVPRFAGQLVIIPKLLSKWGSAHEVVHAVRDCPYSGTVEYYRVIG